MVISSHFQQHLLAGQDTITGGTKMAPSLVHQKHLQERYRIAIMTDRLFIVSYGIPQEEVHILTNAKLELGLRKAKKQSLRIK